MGTFLNVRRVAGHVVINFPDTRLPFVDAQDMHNNHPDTFEAPSLEEIRATVLLGSYVKLSTGSERFWCSVLCIFEEGDPDSVSFIGVVCNEVVMTGVHGLSDKDFVYFTWSNILGIYNGDDAIHSVHGDHDVLGGASDV